MSLRNSRHNKVFGTMIQTSSAEPKTRSEGSVFTRNKHEGRRRNGDGFFGPTPHHRLSLLIINDGGEEEIPNAQLFFWEQVYRISMTTVLLSPNAMIATSLARLSPKLTNLSSKKKEKFRSRTRERRLLEARGRGLERKTDLPL